ncbi:hypothetical protein ScPMuIL_000689 [Solemya velum]
MSDNLPYSISPSEDVITSRVVGIRCPVEGCKAILSTYSLKIHLVMSHTEGDGGQKRKQKKNIAVHFHCPVDQCMYNASEELDKNFKNFQQLKQHYMKVHAPKKRCSKCKKPFGLDRELRRHEQNCGTVYKCLECPHSYPSRESLLTHCKRHGHTIPVLDNTNRIIPRKTKKISDLAKQNIIVVNVFPDASGKYPLGSVDQGEQSYQPILPKPLTAIVTKTSVTVQQTDGNSTASTSLSQNIHVDTRSKNGLKPAISRTQRRNLKRDRSPLRGRSQLGLEQGCDEIGTSSTGIQTSVSFPHQKRNRHRAATGTQTSGDVILKRAMVEADIPVNNVSTGTQASVSVPKRKTPTISSHTQTNEGPPLRRRRKRRTSEKASGSDGQNQFSADVNKFFMDMLDVLGSSTSTQTSLTFPIQDVNHLDCQSIETQTSAQVELDQQSIETQTPATVFTHRTLMCTTADINNGLDSIDLLYPISRDPSTSTTDINGLHSENPSTETTFSTVFSNATISDTETIPLYTVNLNHLSSNKSFDISDANFGSRSTFLSEPPVSNSLSDGVTMTSSDFCAGTSDNSGHSLISGELNFEDIMQSSLSDISEVVQQTDKSDGIIADLSQREKGGRKDRLFSGFQSDFECLETETDDMVTLETAIVSMETDIVTMDTEVQTLTSASDFDLLMESNAVNFENTEPAPMANTQTQTVDDVWDMLMTSMETQTTDDFLLPALSFSDIQTQTVLEPDSVQLSTVHTQTGTASQQSGVLNPQSSAHTQTLSLQMSGLNDSGQQTDEQTQTSSKHFGDLDKSDTHTQTTFDNLESLLAHLEN